MNTIPYVKQTEVFDKIIVENIPYVKTKGLRCDYIYCRGGENGVKLLRCVPKNGNLIFEVGGTYSKSVPICYKFILAKLSKEAKKRYFDIFGWKATECRCIPPNKESEEILTDYRRMPL